MHTACIRISIFTKPTIKLIIYHINYICMLNFKLIRFKKNDAFKL